MRRAENSRATQTPMSGEDTTVTVVIEQFISLHDTSRAAIEHARGHDLMVLAAVEAQGRLELREFDVLLSLAVEEEGRRRGLVAEEEQFSRDVIEDVQRAQKTIADNHEAERIFETELVELNRKLALMYS